MHSDVPFHASPSHAPSSHDSSPHDADLLYGGPVPPQLEGDPSKPDSVAQQNAAQQMSRFDVKSFAVSALFGALAGAGLVAAIVAPPSMPSLSDVQSDVNRLTQGQAKADAVFPGPKGLTGVLMTGPKGPVIGWVTNDRSAFIVGGVIDAKSNANLTAQATQKYIVDAQNSGVIGALAQATGGGQNAGGDAQNSAQGSVTPPLPVMPSSGAAIVSPPPASAAQEHTQGNTQAGAAAIKAFLSNPGVPSSLRNPAMTGKKVLYVFIDPNCINCHAMFEMVNNMIPEFNKAGVTVQWVPVAIMGPTSLDKSAELLWRGYPAMVENESKFNEAAEIGGLSGKVPKAQAAALEAQVQSLTQILARLTLANQVGAGQTGQVAVGTPTLVWDSGPGNPFILSGVPSKDMMGKILESFSPDWKPPKTQNASH